MGNSDSSKRGPKVTTWKMSLNVFKHYISSSQAERGYRTRAKLHQAEEELEQLKTAIRKTGGYNVNPVTQLADILDDPAMNSRLMLELMHRTQTLKLENQIQAQDIEFKTGIIKVQAETIQELAPKAAVADRLMSVEGSMFRFTESDTKVC